MGKTRRTRKQKLAAKHRWSPVSAEVARETQKLQPGARLLVYDPGLIRADLTKTLVLSILAIATIVVIYFLRVF